MLHTWRGAEPATEQHDYLGLLECFEQMGLWCWVICVQSAARCHTDKVACDEYILRKSLTAASEQEGRCWPAHQLFAAMLFFGPIALLALAIPELWQKQSKGERYDLVLIRTGPAADPLIFADAVLRSPSYRIAGLVTVLDAAMNLGWTPTVSTTGIAIVLQLVDERAHQGTVGFGKFVLFLFDCPCTRLQFPDQISSAAWEQLVAADLLLVRAKASSCKVSG